MKLGVFGMTPGGLAMAATLASKGFRTAGVDPDRGLVERLSERDLPVREPGLAELLDRGESLSFTDDPGVLASCDLVYLAWGPRVDDEGRSEPGALEAMVELVVGHLSPTAVLALTCAAPPGFTRSVPWPSERLFFQVETPVPGRAVERATTQERVALGCAEPSRPLPPALDEVLAALGRTALPMRYESAELARLSVGVCIAGTMSVVNTLAELCEQMGVDWSEIVPALRLDRRIGPDVCLSPGLWLTSGPDRDLAMILRLASVHRTDAEVAAAAMVNARHRQNWVVDTIRRLGLDAAGQPLAVWGLADGVHDDAARGSGPLRTLAQFPDTRFNVHDPTVREGVLPKMLTRVRSPLQALDGASALLVLTPWPEYRAIAPAAIADQLAGSDIVDPFRALDRAAVRAADLQHHVLGAGAD